MNTLLLSSSIDCIGRQAFQTLFHQALVAEGSSPCLGLLGSVHTNTHCVQHVALAVSPAMLYKVQQLWHDKGVACVGFFHLENTETPSFLEQAMTDEYLRLAIKLDEKGRLDLLAFACDKRKGKCMLKPLTLIEDGQ